MPVGFREGFVYLFEADLGGHRLYKIGASDDPPGRLKSFTSGPAPVRLVHQIPTESMRHLEGWLHRRYAKCRVRGEWFALSPDEIAEFCGWTVDPRGRVAPKPIDEGDDENGSTWLCLNASLLARVRLQAHKFGMGVRTYLKHVIRVGVTRDELT